MVQFMIKLSIILDNNFIKNDKRIQGVLSSAMINSFITL